MMPTVRQLASGITYAVVSLVLVIGALALSLAQGGPARPPASTPTPHPQTPTNTESVGPTQAAGPTSPASTAASTMPAQPPPTSSYPRPTLTATSRAARSPTRSCGPYAGWIRSYVVQPGDTQYRIATQHGITVSALQVANCRFSTLIYVGEILWVPFVLPPPTELTLIPTFDTPTDEPAAVTPTASPPTPETPDP